MISVIRDYLIDNCMDYPLSFREVNRAVIGNPPAYQLEIVNHIEEGLPGEGSFPPLDVFVNPSRWEGFGLTLLEALAAGLPCIASCVDSLPEVGGDFVTWTAPDDPDGLCAAMRRVSSAPAPPGAAGMQRTYVERFSQESMTEHYLALYGALRGQGGA